jgi:hypothetical protein
MPTNFSKKCEILGSLWMDFRGEPEFQDFVEYNDMGLPLAYFIAEGVVAKTPEAEMYINETYDLFLAALEAPDEEYDSLEDLLMRFGK